MGDKDTELKVEINNLIHMYGSENVRLAEARKISFQVYTMIKQGFTASDLCEDQQG
jgi:hypothetical protein